MNIIQEGWLLVNPPGSWLKWNKLNKIYDTRTEARKAKKEVDYFRDKGQKVKIVRVVIGEY